ncbi:U1 small nuclear ribonucleoprotein 70 kDa-like isoform X2 [Zophobas morio]|uniref:U1 small nuclear ribonucleoprotein 70 kDa-like isoform X2 n=1 Tax=Zophobas morio TaxID=2755281 RepID=UPI0030836CD8
MFLPPHLAVLFKPRDPIPYLPPGKLSHEKKFPPYSGVANLVAHFENPQDTPPPHKIKTLEEYKEEKRRAKCLQTDEKLKEEIAKYKPKEAEGLTGDPFKTLFVARINYEVSESKLIREFEQFGRIKQGKLVYDRFSGKSRGYAFLEFEKEEDMLVAYREGDGMKIEGRRVLVDVERGRTVEGFLPRRLGGGLGATRKGKPEECVKHSGREPARLRSPDRRDSSRYHMF